MIDMAFFKVDLIIHFYLFFVLGWKLSPMVGAVYGPELYAGRTLYGCFYFCH